MHGKASKTVFPWTHHPRKLMIWDAINQQGTILRHRCDFSAFYAEKATRLLSPGKRRERFPKELKFGSLYYRRQVLSSIWLPYSNDHGNSILLDDGAPAHRAKRLKTGSRLCTPLEMKFPIYQYQSPYGRVLPPWPSDSPDLNPIEDLWSNMKLYRNTKCPMTISQIKKVC